MATISETLDEAASQSYLVVSYTIYAKMQNMQTHILPGAEIASENKSKSILSYYVKQHFL